MYFRSPTAKPDPKRDKVLMEEARSMMAEIFPSLESELLLFVSAYEKLDSFFTMNALVRLSKHVLSAQDTGSFLAISLGTVLVQVRNRHSSILAPNYSFDSLIQYPCCRSCRGPVNDLVDLSNFRLNCQLNCGSFGYINMIDMI